MSHELLRTWLKLQSGPWPPDHYTLLGLARGKGTTDEIEQCVLERMDLLRRHQLLHPDPVTEGMNLLAQAMICLTDPAARADYDRSIGLTASTPPKPAPPPVESPVPSRTPSSIPVAPPIELPPPIPKPKRPTELKEPPPSPSMTNSPPIVASWETVPPPQVVVFSLDDAPPPVADDTAPLIPDVYEEDEERIIVEEWEDRTPEPRLPRHRIRGLRIRQEARAARGAMYAELVHIRRLLRVWEPMRQLLADQSHALTRRTDIITFINYLNTIRPWLARVTDLIGGPDQPGYLVATLAKQAPVVEMFRSFLPSQKESLAQDCRAAHFRLEERRQTLRAMIREQTAKGLMRRVYYPTLVHLRRSPEWLLLALGSAALAIAIVRSMPG